MAMLTLNGILHNCYEQAESKDRETGEVRPAHIKAQILCENTTPTGEKRFEMVMRATVNWLGSMCAYLWGRLSLAAPSSITP
jgi:hypothetical protein